MPRVAEHHSSSVDLVSDPALRAEVQGALRLNDIKMSCGVPYLPLTCPEREIKAQSSSGVPFDAALESALRSFLEDDSDVESPLSLVRGEAEEKGMGPVELLRRYMNQAASSLVLVPREGPDSHPEHGESVVKNWVFRLSLPQLSDHIYWAVVDRSGLKPTYNYGFN
jgi:hypothetical protein